MDIVKDIISFNQNINNIETAFENAVYISLNTRVKNSDTVYLKRFHFHWDKNESSSIQEKVYSKHANILEFLDRYEKAAENALQKGWKINGNTVGRSFSYRETGLGMCCGWTAKQNMHPDKII